MVVLEGTVEVPPIADVIEARMFALATVVAIEMLNVVDDSIGVDVAGPAIDVVPVTAEADFV